MEKEESKKGNITNIFNGPVGQYIEHVEHNHFGMEADGRFRFGDADSATAQRRLFPNLPTEEQMCQAVAATVRDGLWYGNQAWAVVYRAYQMCGYMGSMSDFVREVQDWQIELAKTCTYDAVQKPIAKGTMIGKPDKWTANGAPELAVTLVEELMTELERMT